jgi:hypothetical protein
MKAPSRVHDFFAEDRPLILGLGADSLLGMYLAARERGPTLALLGDGFFLLQFLGILVRGMLLGYYSVALAGLFIIGPLALDAE